MGAGRSEATNAQGYRLLPLQHLQLIVANTRLKEAPFLKIAPATCTLKESSAGPKESADIDSFINQISALKYHCEDEHEDL